MVAAATTMLAIVVTVAIAVAIAIAVGNDAMSPSAMPPKSCSRCVHSSDNLGENAAEVGLETNSSRRADQNKQVLTQSCHRHNETCTIIVERLTMLCALPMLRPVSDLRVWILFGFDPKTC